MRTTNQSILYHYILLFLLLFFIGMLLPVARADHMRLFELLLRINYFAYAL